MSIPVLHPSNFRVACREMLEFLSDRTQMSLWMVTRVNGDEWIVIDVIDKHYNVYPMRQQQWSDSFSCRMVMGLGPKVASRVTDVPAYVNSVSYAKDQIGAYIAIPLELPDGRLFGTISGVNNLPMTDELHKLLPELELLGRCLMHIYECESLAAKLELKNSHLETPRWVDNQTGALTYEAWLSDCIDIESARVNYLDPAGILYLEAPGYDSSTAKWVVTKLKELTFDFGTVYRDGSESFFVVFRGPTKDEQNEISKQIRSAIEKQIPESKCAWTYRDPHSTTLVAFNEAKKLAQAKPKARRAA